MQRDLFDDDTRDTVGPDTRNDTRDDTGRDARAPSADERIDERTQEERLRARERARTAHAEQARVKGYDEKPHMGQAAPPPHGKPDVIEAEVVEEVAAARPRHDEAEPASKREKLLLIAFIAVLLGCILLLQGQTKALQSTNFAETPTLNVPVVVRYAPIDKPRLTQEEEIKVSFAEIKDNAAKLQESMKALSRPKVVPSSKVLSPEDYQAMRQYLAQKEGITNEADVRDILLQAGYKLPARLPEEEAKKDDKKNHVAFARDVINRLLKDEVEDFLEKVQIASEVGVYVAENAEK